MIVPMPYMLDSHRPEPFPAFDLHAPFMAQCAHEPQQEDFPRFFSRRMPKRIAATTAISAAQTKIVPMFCEIQVIMVLPPASHHF